MSDGVPRDRWHLRAGDGAGYSLELPFDPTGYTGWKGQLRPAPVPEPTFVELGVDQTGLAGSPPVIRFFLLGTQVVATMDGWGGDMECITPAGQPMTLVEVEVSVDPEYTTP